MLHKSGEGYESESMEREIREESEALKILLEGLTRENMKLCRIIEKK